MKARHFASIILLLGVISLGFSGCYPECRCNDHGGCFEGTCECEPGYMGTNCEFVAGQHLAASYDAVSLSGSDTLRFTTVLSPDPDDITHFFLSNFHGLSTVHVKFEGTLAEASGEAFFTFPQQSLGSTATLWGRQGNFDVEGTSFVMNYAIIDAGDTTIWDATAVMQ